MPIPSKWVLREPWVIRIKGTNQYIPQTHSRSTSHFEPVHISGRHFPKMWTTPESARAFLAQYCRGRMTAYDGMVEVQKSTKRDKKQFEIIQLQLVLVPD